MKDHSHKTYYIFKHTNGENVQYLTKDNGWDGDFVYANLLVDEELAFRVATNYANTWATQDNTRFVIGCANVDVDPLYPMRVAK